MKRISLCLAFGAGVCACTVSPGQDAGTDAGAKDAGGAVEGAVFGPAGATTLLVDNEWAPASSATTTASYTTFTGLLAGAGLTYDTFITNPQGADGEPSASVLDLFQIVVWFTGATSGKGVGEATLTAAQEAVVRGWLDQGGRTLLLFSENLIYDLSDPHCSWAGPEADPLLATYVGASGDDCNFTCDVCTGHTVDKENYTITPALGSQLGSRPFQVDADTPISSTADAIYPLGDATVLATVPLDPNGTGDVNAAVILGRTGIGANATSQIVYVGAPIEDLSTATGDGTATALFSGLLAFLGL